MLHKGILKDEAKVVTYMSKKIKSENIGRSEEKRKSKTMNESSDIHNKLINKSMHDATKRTTLEHEEDELDSLLDGNWNPNNSIGSIKRGKNSNSFSFVRRITYASSKVSDFDHTYAEIS